MDLGVSRVPKRVESTGPGCDESARGQDDQDDEGDNECDDDECSKQGLELLARDELSYGLYESDELKQTKDTCKEGDERDGKSGIPREHTERSHMFTRSDGKEPNERNLHRRQRANHIPRRIRDVNLVTEPPHQNKHERMQRDHVGDEYVSAPCGDHPSVEDGGEHAPECGSLFNGADPEVECVHEEEDGDGFVVVGAGDGSGDVACEDVGQLRGKGVDLWMLGLPGTIPMNAAANNPVDSSAISQVNLSSHQQLPEAPFLLPKGPLTNTSQSP